MPELALACQQRMGYVSLVERKDPERADPITRLIASRVREIRQQQRLSGAALGAAVRDLGLQGWVDSTVGKLETSRRESVTVRELLALAVVLGVPPVWLLVDPKAGTPVPVAEGIEVDPWTALLWLTGSQPLEGPGGDAWTSAQYALRPLVTLAKLLENYRRLQETFDMPMMSRTGAGDMVAVDPAEARRDLEATETRTLQSIANQLGQFRDLAHLPVPQVPPDVRKRAVELGIELPGQEGFAP
jgi:transcriptional regulator with XRE-family HTH domain